MTNGVFVPAKYNGVADGTARTDEELVIATSEIEADWGIPGLTDAIFTEFLSRKAQGLQG